MIEISNALYLVFYFITILYFVMLGCYVLTQHGTLFATHGEQQAKRRMTKSVGIFMLLWALQCLVYLPAILIYGYEETQKGYDLCFLITVMLNTPALFAVMHSIVQKKTNTLRWVAVTSMPFLLLATWQIIPPQSV